MAALSSAHLKLNGWFKLCLESVASPFKGKGSEIHFFNFLFFYIRGQKDETVVGIVWAKRDPLEWSTCKQYMSDIMIGNQDKIRNSSAL